MPHDTNGHSLWPTWKSNRLFTLLLAILFAYAIVWLGTLVRLNTLQAARIGVADSVLGNIGVDGTGTVTGAPTVASAALGLETRGSDVPTAQRENTDTMNRLIEQLKALGISGEDIQTTNYAVYPNYQYDPKTGRNLIDGYLVSQQVTVKIRDLTKIGTVLGVAGEAGLNQISGLRFTIDEPETLRAEARDKALRAAREKAERIAVSLGVRLGRVMSFNESVGGFDGPVPYAVALGQGGGGTPSIETGSLDVTVHVNVTYEIE